MINLVIADLPLAFLLISYITFIITTEIADIAPISNTLRKYSFFSKNTDVYFNFLNVVNYIEKKTPASKLNYFERLKILGIRENTIHTKYFINALKGYKGYEY